MLPVLRFSSAREGASWAAQQISVFSGAMRERRSLIAWSVARLTKSGCMSTGKNTFHLRGKVVKRA
jgi:hypothetical protein